MFVVCALLSLSFKSLIFHSHAMRLFLQQLIDVAQMSVQVVIAVATLAAALVLFGLRAKTGTSPSLLGIMLTVWASGFVFALLFQSVSSLPSLPQDARRYFADASDALDRQRRLNNRQKPFLIPSLLYYECSYDVAWVIEGNCKLHISYLPVRE